MAERHSTKAALIPAAAYFRMSTDRQDKSIAEQREELEPWAKDNGYRIVAEYVDEGISGDKSRPNFQRLVGDSSLGNWSAIVMWDQDRWSRHDLVKTAYYVQQLRDSNVHIHTINQGRMDWASFEDRIVWAVQQESKHMYLVDMAKNTLRGKRSKAGIGRLFLRLPRGYSKTHGDPPTIAPNNDAPFVRRAFEAYASGFSIREVAKQLHDDGVTNSSGGLMAPSTVRRMLKNPIYFGRYEFNRDQSGRKYGKTEAIIQIDDNHPPIISRELFDRVQVRFKTSHNKTATKKHYNYPLSGLLRCRCGKVLYGRTAHSGNRYYRCQGGPYGDQSCSSERVVAGDVESALPEALGAAFSTPATVAKLEESLANEIEKRAKASRTAPDAAQKRLRSVRTKLQALEERLAIVDPDMVSIITDAIRAKRTELRKAESDVQAAKVADGVLGPEEIKARQQKAIEVLANLPQTLAELSAPDQNRVLSGLVERVDVKVNVLPPMQSQYPSRARTRPRYEFSGAVIVLSREIAAGVFTSENDTVVHNIPISGTSVQQLSFKIRAA